VLPAAQRRNLRSVLEQADSQIKNSCLRDACVSYQEKKTILTCEQQAQAVLPVPINSLRV